MHIYAHIIYPHHTNSRSKKDRSLFYQRAQKSPKHTIIKAQYFRKQQTPNPRHALSGKKLKTTYFDFILLKIQENEHKHVTNIPHSPEIILAKKIPVAYST